MRSFIITDLLAGTGKRIEGTPLFGTRWQAEAYTDRMYQAGETRHLFVRVDSAPLGHRFGWPKH